MVIDDLSPAAFPKPERCQRFLDACPQLSPIFEKYARAGHMPSVVYGVVVDSELVFTNTFRSRVAGHSLEPDQDTILSYRVDDQELHSGGAAHPTRLRHATA